MQASNHMPKGGRAMNDVPIFEEDEPDYDDPELLNSKLRDGIVKQLQRPDLSPEDREQYLKAFENLGPTPQSKMPQ
jgi:hypothetical protein